MTDKSPGIADIELPTPESVITVVRDIDSTVALLESKFGIGPWEKQEYAPTKDELLVGEPFKLRFAFAQVGSLVL